MHNQAMVLNASFIVVTMGTGMRSAFRTAQQKNKIIKKLMNVSDSEYQGKRKTSVLKQQG